MPVTGIVKDLITSRNEGIDILRSFVKAVESGTIDVQSDMICKRCRQYLEDTSKMTI